MIHNTMVPCTICSSQINEADNELYYQFSNMGPDIISKIEYDFGREVDQNGTICAHWFANIMQTMSASALADKSVDAEYKPQLRHETNVCVWCQRSLHMRRTHPLPEGHERHLISERISPRVILDGELVCYGCWVRVRRILEQQPQVRLPEGHTPSAIIPNTCVSCLRSLAQTRRHSLPDGPVRNEIMTRIHPRTIPPNGRVCYACWVSARRSIQRAETIDERRQTVSAHANVNCVSCGMPLFRRQTHTLPSGLTRDELAVRIYPRLLPEHALLCTSCWKHTRDNVHVKQENIEQRPTISTMELDQFTHTTSSSAKCFVPSCANSERSRVTDHLRKRILTSRKVFVTENARVCKEHKTLYNWEFLDQHEFSNSFTKSEMESMLALSVKEMDIHFNFEHINMTEFQGSCQSSFHS